VIVINTEKLITKLRNIVAAGTSLALTDVFSPDLPQDGEDICCMSLLGGTSEDKLNNTNMYNIQTLRVLIRGTENDTTTRALVDEVRASLHLLSQESYTGGNIISCMTSGLPTYVGKDANQRILYNMNFRLQVE